MNAPVAALEQQQVTQTRVQDLLRRMRPDLPAKFSEFEAIKKQRLRFLAIQQGLTVPPYEVLVHPSSVCNLACDWCIGEFVPMKSASSGSIEIIPSTKFGPQRLPDVLADPAAMMRVVSDIADYRREVEVQTESGAVRTEFSVEAVSFSGLIGEPLTCRKALLPAMEFLADRNIRTGVFTNGTLMDERVREVLLRTDYVMFSLDAATPSTYAKIKFGGRDAGVHMFEKAVANTAELARQKRADPSSRLTVNASFILYPGNFAEVFEAAKLAKSIGVECFRVKQDNSGGARLSDATLAEVRVLLDKIENELVDTDFRLVRIHRELEDWEIRRSFSTCNITDLMAAVGSDGCLYPCNYHPRPGGISYGSAVELGFSAVWEGAARATMKRCLPQKCPATCDPFKNRANHILEPLRHEFLAAGPVGVSKLIDTLGMQ